MEYLQPRFFLITEQEWSGQPSPNYILYSLRHGHNYHPRFVYNTMLRVGYAAIGYICIIK